MTLETTLKAILTVGEPVTLGQLRDTVDHLSDLPDSLVVTIEAPPQHGEGVVKMAPHAEIPDVPGTLVVDADGDVWKRGLRGDEWKCLSSGGGGRYKPTLTDLEADYGPLTLLVPASSC